MNILSAVLRFVLAAGLFLNSHMFMLSGGHKPEKPQSQPMEDVQTVADGDHDESSLDNKATLQSSTAVQEHHISLKTTAFDRQASPLYVDLLHQSVRLQI